MGGKERTPLSPSRLPWRTQVSKSSVHTTSPSTLYNSLPEKGTEPQVSALREEKGGEWVVLLLRRKEEWFFSLLNAQPHAFPGLGDGERRVPGPF